MEGSKDDIASRIAGRGSMNANAFLSLE